MELSKNIIKKLTVEVDTSSMAFGLQIKNDIDGFLQQHIYPKIAQYLEQRIPENEMWRYDRINLEIDLDTNESFSEVPTQIITKLERTFDEHSATNSIGEIEQITPVSVKKNNIDAFLKFLKTGQYPWWFETKKVVTISDFIAIKNKLIKERIYSEMNKTIAFNRLIYQFDNQFITRLYYWYHFEDKIESLGDSIKIPMLLKSKHKSQFWSAMLSHNKSNIISFFKEIILQLNTNKIVAESVHYELPFEASKRLVQLIEFCNKTLKIGVVITPVKTTQNVFKITLTSDYNQAILVNEKVVRNTLDTQRKSEGQTVLKFIISSGGKDLKKGMKFVAKSEENTKENTPPELPIISGANLDKEHRKGSAKTEENKALEKEKKGAVEEEMIIDGTIIEKAGLVLLHPFLKHFFINMELLTENKIRPDKQDLAVHLLHYIATKNEQPSEHDLIFEKYLCHIPVNQPINRFVELTSEQKNSCDELLQAVLKHWSALRTNSIDALRSEFLLRQGKLTINNDSHRLFIQRNTQDILLDTLPWNLHLVKLPWKKQLLYVEW